MDGNERPERSPDQENVDVTLIRDLLAMTPAERFELLVQAARNLIELREKRRIV